MVDFKQPSNYKSRITPYSQRLLQFGIEDSKLYLSRNTNAIFDAFTIGHKEKYEYENPITHEISDVVCEYGGRRDCIIDGLSTVASFLNNVVTVIIKPGVVICDNTLLIFPEPTTITLDVTNYDDTGFLIVAVNYHWVDTVYENAPKLRIVYSNTIGDTISPETQFPWSPSVDRLIITTLTFKKNNNLITSLTNKTPDPFNKLISETREVIKIKEFPYEIAPLPNIWYNIMKNIQLRNGIYMITAGTQNYIEAIPPFTGAGIYYYVPIDISSVYRKNCIVQCYINDVKIEAAGIQHVSDRELRVWFPDYFVLNNPPPVKVLVMG